MDATNSRTNYEDWALLQINSTPNHPTTCGKVERFQQTLKRWLTHQQPATTIVELQTQIDAFTNEYNHRRPHRSPPHRATPATSYQARPKAAPGTRVGQDLNITIINAVTGELLRELTLDPTRDYQPTGAPKGPTRKKP